MFSSLRFRLPALFLLGIVVSGLIASVVALRLFQGYVLNRSKADLRREAVGLTEVFAQQAITANDTGALPRIARQLERATGDQLFYVGVSPVPGKNVGLELLPQSTVDWRSGRTITFEFTPPRANKTYVAVAFDNSGRAITLNFIVVNGPDGWVIADVESPHDSLRMFLAQYRN